MVQANLYQYPGAVMTTIRASEIENMGFFPTYGKTALEFVNKFSGRKPTIVTNGGLYDMSTGRNVMSFVYNGVEQNYQNGFEGIGITKKSYPFLTYGVDNQQKWDCFMSAYPMLVKEGVKIINIGKAKELDGKRQRTAIGFNSNNDLFILTADKPGMTFAEMQDVFMSHGVSYAMNLDGGGSVIKVVNGKVANDPTEYRRVNNVFCVWEKPDPLSKFTDKDKIASWAKDAFKWGVSNGIMEGDNHNRLNPKNNITREEMLVMLHRAYNKFKQGE